MDNRHAVFSSVPITIPTGVCMCACVNGGYEGGCIPCDVYVYVCVRVFFPSNLPSFHLLALFPTFSPSFFPCLSCLIFFFNPILTVRSFIMYVTTGRITTFENTEEYYELFGLLLKVRKRVLS
jgi:hypothetical protein